MCDLSEIYLEELAGIFEAFFHFGHSSGCMSA